jgi:hypothetical protein
MKIGWEAKVVFYRSFNLENKFLHPLLPSVHDSSCNIGNIVKTRKSILLAEHVTNEMNKLHSRQDRATITSNSCASRVLPSTRG